MRSTRASTTSTCTAHGRMHSANAEASHRVALSYVDDFCRMHRIDLTHCTVCRK